MQIKNFEKIRTLGELKKNGYHSRSIKDELRENLIAKLKNRERTFEEILGYEHSVIPDIERAIHHAIAGWRYSDSLPRLSIRFG